LSIAEKIVVICIAELLYVFLLYPLLLRFLAVFFKKPVQNRNGFLPTVDVVIAAYNEEKLIEGAVRSVYADGYPHQLLKVWVGNDGSADRTAEILANLQKEFPTLHVKNFGRTGKNGVLNELFKKLIGEITVLMDADSLIEKGGISALVSVFGDKNVGAAIGEISFKKLDENGNPSGESAYKTFERLLRTYESRIDSVVSSLGAFYAMRRELIEPIPNDKVCDDYFPLLRIAAKGRRILFVPEAQIIEARENEAVYEKKRIIRFTSGGLASIWETKRLFVPGAGHGWYTFFLWSHKILRWLSPFFLAAMFVASGIAAFKSSLMLMLFIAQSIFYILAFFGWLAEKQQAEKSFLKLCYFFVVMNISMMIGVIRFFKNSSTAVWEPSKG
jgi:cellulose synthase/poly-beta-1,6-N-acetylglucosamine synthase-like glycosyltransferase